MTWTATERTFDNDIGPQTLVIDIRKTSTDLVCQLWADADDDAAVQQMRARARLIVAAEDLLAALKWAKAQLNEDGTRHSLMDRAIIKATQEKGDDYGTE